MSVRKNDKNELVFGIRAIIEAIEAGKEIEKVLIKKGIKSPLLNALYTLIQERNIPFQYVPSEKLNRICSGNHQGVIAFISPVEYTDLDMLIPILFESGKTPILLVLDRITDVRNFGALVRTAACAGVDAIILPLRGGAIINADAVKTSAGAMHSMPLVRVADLKPALRQLQNSGITVVGATEKGADLYNSLDYTVPFALVMGSEETGLSAEVLETADHLLQIPLQGHITSLNVSVAAGVCLFEAVRQRMLLA